jgi:hypothetical protein
MSDTGRRAAIALIALASILGLAVAISVATPKPPPEPSTSDSPRSDRPATAAPGDATVHAYRDFTLLPGDPTDPAGRSLQSRLWSIDGRWWGALVEPGTRETRIHELSLDGSTWSDTGVVIDERPGAMADALWSGDHLYVASAVPGRSPSNGVRVTRFSRDAGGRFVLDPNFPFHLTERGVAAASIARDTSGRLWAAFVQEGRVLVTHSVDDEAVWSPPEPVGDEAATVGPADVAALVADGTGRLGLAWSDSGDKTILFANRDDRDAPDRWFPTETALEGLPLADEPISVAADEDGTVFVAVETAVADDPGAGPTDPGSVILARDPAGTWRTALIARVEDRLGQPVAVVDRGAGDLYVFAASPRRGGTIHVKRSGFDRLEFPAGRGLTVIADPSNPDIAFLTSTKGPIELADGFVVLGFDEQTGFYWHAVIGPPTGVVLPSASSSSSPGASPSPSAGSPSPGRAALFTDNFDPWPLDGPIGNGWEVGPIDAPGTLTAVSDPSGTGRNALVQPTGSEAVRACKAFAPTAAGTLVAEVRVRLDGIGPADAVITSIRDRSGEAASVRFGQGGTVAYYAGDTKVRTTIPFRLGTWYRSVVTVHPESRTYDWRLTTDDGRAVLAVTAIRFRESAATQVAQICVQTSAGAPDVGLRFDDVRVSR